MKKADTLRAVALLALIAAAVAALIALSVNAPLREALGESLGRFRGWAWGPVVYGATYALACLVLPGSLITLAAGQGDDNGADDDSEERAGGEGDN